jgi:hypothetical protein
MVLPILLGVILKLSIVIARPLISRSPAALPVSFSTARHTAVIPKGPQ